MRIMRNSDYLFKTKTRTCDLNQLLAITPSERSIQENEGDVRVVRVLNIGRAGRAAEFLGEY